MNKDINIDVDKYANRNIGIEIKYKINCEL